MVKALKRRKRRIPSKIILISSLSLITTFLALFLSTRFLLDSDYFTIRNVEYSISQRYNLAEDKEHYLREFGGENIFKVNLKAAAQRLSNLFTDYERITLRRKLANTLIVDFIPRQAVAKIKLSRIFYSCNKKVS